MCAPTLQYLLDYSRGGVLDYNPDTTSVQEGTLAATTYLMVDFMKTGRHSQIRMARNARAFYQCRSSLRTFRARYRSPGESDDSTPDFGSRTDTDTMPSIAINYRLLPTWSAYAQIAKGFLAPNLQLFYVLIPIEITLSPKRPPTIRSEPSIRQVVSTQIRRLLDRL